MNFSIEKIKSIIIVVLVCIIVFGGSYVSSELSYYRNQNVGSSNVLDVSNDKFNKIDMTSYLSLLKSSNLSLIYIGKSDCSYSQAQDVVFEEMVDEYNIEVNYLGLDYLDNNAIEALYSSYDKFISEGLSTPTILLVQNGEVKMYKKGYTSKDNLILLLKDNNFMVE